MYRAPGLTGYPNNNSFLMDIYLPLGLYLLLSAKTLKMKILYGVSIFVCLLALFFSLAKGSILTFGVMLGILFFYLPLKNKLQTLFTFMVIGILFILMNVFLHLGIIESIILRFNDKSSILWRFKIWHFLISSITPITLLIGNGIGSSKEFLLKVNPMESVASHNMYLEYIYEYGVWGLAYFLNLIILGYKFFKASTLKLIPNNIYYIVPFLITIVILMDAISSNGIGLRSSMNYAWVIITAFYIKLARDKVNIKNG
jgi:O-antigen ligase